MKWSSSQAWRAFRITICMAAMAVVPRTLRSAESQPVEPAETKQAWTLHTDDTTLTLCISADQKLTVEQLSSPAGWNWTETPSEFPLLDRVEVAGTSVIPGWVFGGATVEETDGKKLTLVFHAAEPSLECRSIWHARPGPGPIHLSMDIVNKSDQVITWGNQESIELSVVGPNPHTSVWYIRDDGGLPDPIGVYHDVITEGYSKELPVSEDADFIPWAAIDARGEHGIYVGWEWSIGRLAIVADASPSGAVVKAGNGDAFRTDLAPGATFQVPPAFIGAYRGDLDNAANSLHKYLFHYSVPALLRKDPTYPKVEWNAFAATGQGQGSWIPTESKYYPLIDDIAPLGFEDIVIDVGWWNGDTTNQPHPPAGHAEFWPRGMRAARDYAHQHGMRFGLYWNCNSSMTTGEGMQHRKDDIQHLFEQFRVDYFRSDGTDGNVVQTGELGPGSRAHYREDLGYWQTKGYYEVIDWLQANIDGFEYENCSGGGRLKDYGIMRRAIRIQDQDRYYPLDARQAFWDSSYAMHPMQLSTLSGSWAEWQASGNVYEFRSASLGAPFWHPDAPNGGNGGPRWSESQKKLIQRAVTTYKTRIRPLVRTGNLYHILPRPDDQRWDGIEYFDPVTGQGAVYLFRPKSPDSRQVVPLKGLHAQKDYWVWCEDGSVRPQKVSGAVLMNFGLEVTLPKPYCSDIVFLQDATTSQPPELVEPAEFSLGISTLRRELFAAAADFQWEVSEHAHLYRVWVSERADFSDPVIVADTALPLLADVPLPPARQLYWKVEAIASGGTRSNSGSHQVFTTPQHLAQGVVFASDLPWTRATAGADNSVHRDTNIHGHTISINGQTYSKGLWTHSFRDSTPADIVFDVSDGKYSSFKATVGLDDQGSQGSVQFQILVDGVLKGESPVMLPKQTHQLMVDLTAARELTLRVLNGGDDYGWDHAVWGQARFIEPGQRDPL